MYKEDMRVKTSLTPPLAVGQAVRLADSERNKVFRKGYTIQNTLEIFKIKRVDRTYHLTVYYLEDLEEEKIEGVFYREEPIPCKIPSEFPIDIIKTRIVNGKKKFLVRWIGYPDKTISWVDENDIGAI